MGEEPLFMMPHASIADERMRTSAVDVILPNTKNVFAYFPLHSATVHIILVWYESLPMYSTIALGIYMGSSEAYYNRL